MLTDASVAAAAARSSHEALCRVGVVKQELRSITATLASVHDDAVALQLQAEAAYALICKVHPLLCLCPCPSPHLLHQVQSKPLFARSSGIFSSKSVLSLLSVGVRDACCSAGAGAGVHRQLPRKLQVRVVWIHMSLLLSFAWPSRFLMGLLADLSSQIASAEAAAVAARSAAEGLLKQACVIAPHHRLIHRDCALLSSPAQFEPALGTEQLGESELRDSARLARDSLSLFPMQVDVSCSPCICLVLIRLLQKAAFHLARYSPAANVLCSCFTPRFSD
jgi:hypothetical protein